MTVGLLFRRSFDDCGNMSSTFSSLLAEEKSGACGTDRVSQLLSFSPEERSSGDVSELESLLTIKTKAELSPGKVLWH